MSFYFILLLSSSSARHLKKESIRSNKIDRNEPLGILDGSSGRGFLQPRSMAASLSSCPIAVSPPRCYMILLLLNNNNPDIGQLYIRPELRVAFMPCHSTMQKQQNEGLKERTTYEGLSLYYKSRNPPGLFFFWRTARRSEGTAHGPPPS